MNKRIFSQSVINEYIEKINSTTSFEQLNDYFSKAKEWIDWLNSSRKIDIDTYKGMKRLLSKHVDNHYEKLKNGFLVKDSSNKFIIFIVIAVFLIICFFVLLYSGNLFGISLLSQNQVITESPDKRVLPFRGILKDINGNAIDSKQDVYFAIYNSPIEGSLLYSGFCIGENGINPEYNGVFTIALGTDCGMKPIPEEIFDKSNSLYLGVRIGNEEEIRPRYKISTFGYSQDTALLGGLPAGKIESSIPYIDETGAIVINSESPILQSTQGIFSIQGKALILKTSKDGAGSILFQPSVGGHTVVTSGNFGIGDLSPTSRLSIVGTEPYSAIASLKNLAFVDEPETSILDLALATDEDGSNATFVNFYANATRDTIGDRVGSIRLNKDRVVYETSGADFAEYFSAADNRLYEPGFIMSLSKNGVHAGEMNEPIVGVVTDSAGYIGNMSTKPQQVLIGLIGQLDVFVSDQNGTILVGDAVGASSIPGYGALNLTKNEIVGYSLEDMTSDENHFSNSLCPQEFQNQINKKGNLVRCGRLNILLRPK